MSNEQKAIVSDSSPAIIVAAGPGTGKSLCVAARVVHLIESRGVSPEEVLVLTHGEKSAVDIQHLVDLHTRLSSQGATIASVSSFSSMLLEDYGVSRTSIPWVKDEHLVALVEDSKHLFHLRKYDPVSRHDLTWKDLVDHFTKLQSFGVTPESYKILVNSLEIHAQQAQAATASFGAKTEKEKQLMLQYRLDYVSSHKEISEAYTTFCSLKNETGKFGLVDRLPLASKLVSQDNVRAQLISKFKHIIIDQIEDWGKLEWMLLEALALHPQSLKERESFAFFGDDDLAIMEWAGAPKDAFQKIRSAFPSARLLPLTVNYRCSSEVLASARALISRNSGRLEQATGVLKNMVSHEEYSTEILPSSLSKKDNKNDSKAKKSKAGGAAKKTANSKKEIETASKGSKASKGDKKDIQTDQPTEKKISGVHTLEFKTESDEIHAIGDILHKLRSSSSEVDSNTESEALLGIDSNNILPLSGTTTQKSKSSKSSSSSSLSSALDAPRHQPKNPSSSIDPENIAPITVGVITRFKGDALNLCKTLQTIGVPVPSPLVEYPEIKFLLNILKTVLEPSDSHGLYELLCSGMFSIPGSALAKVTELHQRSTVPLREILNAYLDEILSSQTEMESMSKEDVRVIRRAKKLTALLELLDSRLGSDSMQQLVYRILQETKVLSTHRNPGSASEEKESDNIAKFLTLVEDTEAKLQNNRPAFVWSTLKRVCMQTPTGLRGEFDDFSEVVPVKTVWAAKGYEYDYVIIPHITDDRFPGRMKRNELQELLHQAAGFQMKDSEHISQMRRVLYTAMTRARKGVIFTHHTKSTHSRASLKVSRFIPEAYGVPSAKFLPTSQGTEFGVQTSSSSNASSIHSHSQGLGQSQSRLNDTEIEASHAHALRKLFGDLPPKATEEIEPSGPPRAPNRKSNASSSASKQGDESPIFGGGVFSLQTKKPLPPISLHALQVFLRCPLQFYQQFVIGVTVPTTPLSIFQEAIGAVIHSIATQQVDHRKLSSFDKLRRTFDSTWDSYGIDPVRHPEMYEQGMALSETLLDSEESLHDLASAGTKWRLTSTAADATVSSSSYKDPINKHGETISFSSASDALSEELKGNIPVILEDSFQRVYSNHHVRHFLQYSESFPPETPVLQNVARVLAWAFYKHTKTTPSKVVVEYVTARFQMKLLQFIPTPQHMVEAEAYVNSLFKPLHNGKFEAVASAQNCKRCPFGNTCPSSAMRSKSSL